MCESFTDSALTISPPRLAHSWRIWTHGGHDYEHRQPHRLFLAGGSLAIAGSITGIAGFRTPGTYQPRVLLCLGPADARRNRCGPACFLRSARCGLRLALALPRT